MSWSFVPRTPLQACADSAIDGYLHRRGVSTSCRRATASVDRALTALLVVEQLRDVLQVCVYPAVRERDGSLDVVGRLDKEHPMIVSDVIFADGQ